LPPFPDIISAHPPAIYYIRVMDIPEKNQPPQAQPPAARTHGAAPADEVNLLEILYVLIKYKAAIILLSVIGLVGGYLAAVAKGPAYVSRAVIMAKESDKQLPNLGALGALGGFAAAQLNLAGNPGLDKIEVHFDSRQFKAELIEKYGLLDDIYRLGAPRVYRKYYDTLHGVWTEDEKFSAPYPAKAADLFTKKFISKESDTKRATLTLSVKSGDSSFTARVIEGGLEHLNHYIQTDVQTEAKGNVDYLEQRLITIADPLLREKLQEKIALEIERAMIINREAFKVIDRPYCVRRHKEKIIYPAAAALGMFMLSSAAAIVLYYLMGGGNTNSDSRRWVGMIKKQLFKIV